MTAKRKVAKTAKRASGDESAEFERLLQKARLSSGRGQYVLRLYVTGNTVRSSQAIANVRSLCEEYLSGRYDLQVIDIYQQPSEAAKGQIIAAPTLIKEVPAPVRRLIGDLADRDKVLIGLGLEKVDAGAKAPARMHWLKL
ncbi:MAG TPA: circadian clock KaiB family protein [Chthoniobacter sp.]|jgi:circadian clock protein KaiB